MSTSKHVDRFCLAAVAVTLVLTILFMCGGALGLRAATKTLKYESTLFDTSRVHQIDIVMDDWDAFLETCENEEYASCTVVVDGQKHKNVAIRAKGNTSLSSVRSMGSQRYSFKLEFDHYQKGKTLDGLDKLCLNNLIQDNTMMKDYLVYRMMADFGADSPLCSFVWITVNGEDWGLYLALEGVEDSFLARTYGSDAGELYKPDSMSFGGGRGNGRDFRMDDLDLDDMEDWQSGFPQGWSFPGQPGESGQSGFPQGGQFPGQPGESGQSGFPQGGQFPGQPGGNQQGGAPGGGMGSDDVKLKYIDDDPDSYANIFDNAKTDVTAADQQRLIASLKQLSAYTNLEDVLDMDEVLRYFVVHNFVCNGDSYTGSMIHNYYLHEADGRLAMIPWDYNLAFGTFQSANASSAVNASIDSPVSGSLDDRPMVGWIFSDENYTEQYHALFADFLDRWFSDGQLAALIDETEALIRPYVEKDPTKFCTTEEFSKGTDALKQFVSLRSEAVRRQLGGDSTAVDTTGLTLSDMGTMGGGGGPGGGDMPGGFTPSGRPGSAGSGEAPTAPDQSGEGSDNPGEAPQNPGETPQNPGETPQNPGEAPQNPGEAPQATGETPQNPGGTPQNPGETPQNPGETPQNPGEAPQATGETPQNPGEAPQNPGGTPQNPGETPQNPGEAPQATGEASQNPGGRPQRPDASSGRSSEGQPQPPGGLGSISGTRDSGERSFWILVGVSVLALAAGLVIAVKKKV